MGDVGFDGDASPPARRRAKRGQQNEQALGRSRGGFSTKVHAAVDALGNPVRLILSAGQKADVTYGEALLEDFQSKR